ncbi:hypothetical protein [Paenibacillus sp. FSL E2-0190]|uniref:hypothetical protein n=1 Tax=Paenibacillus sp. FSL E2-0190 TaxID=2954504 RepID=UPI0030EE0E41
MVAVAVAVAVVVAVAVDPANDHTSAVSDSADQRMIILRRIGLRSPANDHSSAYRTQQTL